MCLTSKHIRVGEIYRSPPDTKFDEFMVCLYARVCVCVCVCVSVCVWVCGSSHVLLQHSMCFSGPYKFQRLLLLAATAKESPTGNPQGFSQGQSCVPIRAISQ